MANAELHKRHYMYRELVAAHPELHHVCFVLQGLTCEDKSYLCKTLEGEIFPFDAEMASLPSETNSISDIPHMMREIQSSFEEFRGDLKEDRAESSARIQSIEDRLSKTETDIDELRGELSSSLGGLNRNLTRVKGISSSWSTEFGFIASTLHMVKTRLGALQAQVDQLEEASNTRDLVKS